MTFAMQVEKRHRDTRADQKMVGNLASLPIVTAASSHSFVVVSWVRPNKGTKRDIGFAA